MDLLGGVLAPIAALITHGDTRLRLQDWLTVLGSHASLEEVAVRFEGEGRGRPSTR